MSISTLAEEANDYLADAVELRRKLHQWPEIGNHLPITREAVLEHLKGCQSASTCTSPPAV